MNLDQLTEALFKAKGMRKLRLEREKVFIRVVGIDDTTSHELITFDIEPFNEYESEFELTEQKFKAVLDALKDYLAPALTKEELNDVLSDD